jgi:regulator of protease activity HflC (stomatin/prohibitin superfamily)
MPADMNDYFKKRKPTNSGNGGNNMESNNFESPFKGMGGGKGFSALIILALIGFLFVVFKPFTIINSGEVGIKVNMGKFEKKPLGAGFHMFIPVIQEIIPVNIKSRMIVYSNRSGGAFSDAPSKRLSYGQEYEGGVKYNPAITVKDKRNLNVSIDIAVQYQLKPESAPQVFATIGAGWEDKIINSKVRKVVRNVLGQYSAEEMAEKRGEINILIEQNIRKEVDFQPNKPVHLLAVDLRNINLPDQVQEQINQVQMAKQQKQKAEIDAKKRAAEAQGIAEKNRIEAQGKADKIRIEAQEQAKANKLISDSLTDKLIQLEQIKTQAKFNEALKVNTDAQIFLTPGGAVPNIWVDAKGKEQKVISTQQ